MTPEKIKTNAMNNVRRILRNPLTTPADRRFLGRLQAKIGAGSLSADDAVMAMLRLCRPGMAEWETQKA